MRIAGRARVRRRRREHGHAAVEAALMAPWIFLLFLAVFDLGFYSYAVIATQNAARSAAMHISRSTTYVNDWTRACLVARRELQGMPNVGTGLTNCLSNPASVDDNNPIAVQVQTLTQVQAVDAPASATADPWAARVQVTYRSPQLFPLPGLLGRITVTRFAEARIRDL